MIRLVFLLAFPLVILAGWFGATVRADDVDASQKIAFSDCPIAVQETMTAESKGAKIAIVEEDNQGEEAWYTADVTIKNRAYSITVAEDGTLVQKKLGNEKEQQIKFADCPVSVQKTFLEESDGAKVDSVEKDIRNGQVSYTASVEIGDNLYWITVSNDGTLLDKSLDDAEDDTDADDQGQNPDTAAAFRVVASFDPGVLVK